MRLWDRWTGKLEYLYYDLGSVSYGLPNLVANIPGICCSDLDYLSSIERTLHGEHRPRRFNYKF